MAETFREFLVALGFEVDENSYSKFNTRLGRASAGAAELGTQIVATAVAVEAAVAKMARNFEELYYSSQRTQSSIRALQGFSYGAKTVGVDADRARGAVEGLARAMRSNPGVGALLNQLGVQTKGRGSVEIMNDLIGQLRKMPFYLAQQYGSTFGIDGDTLKMLIDRYDEFRQSQEDYAKRQKEAGVDADKLGEKSRTLMNALRSLTTTLELFGDRALQYFVEPVTAGVKAADDLVKKLIELDKATDGWVTLLSTVGTSALAAWISKILLSRLLFGAAVKEAAGAAAAAGAGSAATGAAGAGAAAAAGGWRLGLRGSSVGAAIGLLGWMKSDDATGNRGRSWLRRKLGIEDDRSGSEDTTSNAKKTVQWLVDHGWTKEQAIGIATNFGRESSFRTNAVGDSGRSGGIGQWNAERRANFRRMFGKDVTQGTLEEQLQFFQHEVTEGTEKFAGTMIRRAGGAAATAAAMSKYYERPKDQQGEMSIRSQAASEWYRSTIGTDKYQNSSPVSLKTENHFNIRSTDPKEAGREVLNGQDEAASRSARYAGQAAR